MNQAKKIVEVKNLKKYFPVTKGFLRRQIGEIKAVNGISFFIREGETLALVGESGCGKTTTGRCLIRAHEATDGEVLYKIDGERAVDITKSDKNELKTLRRNIRMVFQDPYSSLNSRMTVLQIIGESLLINKETSSRRDLKEQVSALLRMVQIDPAYSNRYPHAFSGGQRQRIAVARALALKPKIVIADEPVSALDVSVQAQVLNLLKELQSKLDLTYLFVAHNLAVVKYVSDRVAIMYVGKIVELAATEELFIEPRHPYTEALLSAAPNPDPKLRDRNRTLLGGEVANPASPPSGCYFHPRCSYATEECKTHSPELVNINSNAESPHYVACHFQKELTLQGIP